MTLTEILKAQGLSDEQIKTTIGEMKQNKIFTASEENLDVRYAKLKGDHDNLTAQHTEATTLIEQLKKDASGNQALQGKISGYEATIQQLQEQLKQTQIDAAVKVALLSAKAMDVDYMTFKLKEKGALDLDENGKIQGIEDKLAGLKTQFPNQFEGAGQRKVEPQPLPKDHNTNGGVTRAEFLRKSYTERAKFANENPEAYNTLMGNGE